MGMDVYGKQPTAEVGSYFRRSVWGWKPLVDIIQQLCSEHEQLELFAKCKHWYTNDAAGLDERDSMKLADLLDAAVRAGETKKIIRARIEALLAMPDEKCWLCDGTGTRSDDIGKRLGMTEKVIPKDAVNTKKSGSLPHPRAGQTGWCNGCDGLGYKRPIEESYRATNQDVREFAAFVRHSGGFKIC